MILASFDPEKAKPSKAQAVAKATAKRVQKKVSSRSQARIIAMQYLYQIQINPLAIDQWLQQSLPAVNQDYADLNFARKLIEVCLVNIAQLDKAYQAYSKKGSYHLGKVEKAILRVAMVELMEFKQTPVAVVINEAVNMARCYGSLDSYKLVNALLDAFINDHR